ncbi:LysM peptidoglycan-binding domain-containing protein [bacterium]|nr:LysM peptidoglycan-binding domain-containing protein [bacterium]
MVSSIPSTGSTYTVREGDTLSQIAQRNKTTVDIILKFNKKISNPDEIGIGDTIIIPTEKKAKQEATPPIHAEGDYQIKAGDTLSDIAKAKRTTVKKILEQNPFIKDPAKIKPGQWLNIEKAEYELTEKELKEESKLMEPWFNTLAQHAKQREIERANSTTLETSDIDDETRAEIITRYLNARDKVFGHIEENASPDYLRYSNATLEKDTKYWEDLYKKYGTQIKEAREREDATF